MSAIKNVWSWTKTAVQKVAAGANTILSPGTVEQIKKDTIDYVTSRTNKTFDKIGLGEAIKLQPAYFDRYKPIMLIGGGLLLLFLLFRRK